MNYKFRASIEFEAESLDDALQKIQEHFLAVAQPEEGYKELDFKGEIDLHAEGNHEFYNPRRA